MAKKKKKKAKVDKKKSQGKSKPKEDKHEARKKQAYEDVSESLSKGKSYGKKYLSQLYEPIDKLTEKRSGELKAALQAQKEEQGYTGEKTKSYEDLLAQRQATAGQRSGDIADILARQKAGLEGYSAAENTALREAMSAQQGKADATALRQLRGAQAAAGIRGGLAGAQAQQALVAGQQARTEAERQLFLQNIAEKQQRLGQYEQSVRGAETEEQARASEATQMLGQGIAQGAQTRETAQGQYMQSLTGAEAAERAAEQYNIEQAEAQKNQQVQAQLGIAGMGQAGTSEAEQIALSKYQTKAASDAMSGKDALKNEQKKTEELQKQADLEAQIAQNKRNQQQQPGWGYSSG